MPAFEKTVEIVNCRGLHARAAAKFVRLAESHRARVTVAREDMSVCGTSIMGLLMLGASRHTTISISAEGDGAQEALDALVGLVRDRFGEES